MSEPQKKQEAVNEPAATDLCPGYTLRTNCGRLMVEHAGADDVDDLLELYEEVAQWLTTLGIKQWPPGYFRREMLREGLERGEIYVIRTSAGLAATLRLQWQDTAVWGERPDDAGYIHKLIVSRAWAGCGLGRQLLAWAECVVADAGRSYLRLDCVSSNRVLYEYYLSAGFTCVGLLEKWDTALFEKKVGATNSD